jgi:hypothetical protein
MSEPTTLAEFRGWFVLQSGTVVHNKVAYETFIRAVRRFDAIVYGTDEPCPSCGGTGWDPKWGTGRVPPVCHFCHGTGRLKTPGVVERLKHQVFDAAVAGDGPEMPNTSAALVYGAGLAFEALEREIGVEA